MRRPHDVGGVAGFGPIPLAESAQLFRESWESRVFALTLASSKPGGWNTDMSRLAREDRPEEEYRRLTYYELWLAGLERLAIDHGLVTNEELQNGSVSSAPKPAFSRLEGNVVASLGSVGKSAKRTPQSPPRFSVGDSVKIVAQINSQHTRLPWYAQGRTGEVRSVHGCYVFPDAHAVGEGEAPQWLYTVCFESKELWGQDSDGFSVSIEAWEPYFEKY